MNKDFCELVYWDGAYANNSTSLQPIVIQETRKTPLLAEAQSYMAAVDTFSIDTTDWPIFLAVPKQASASSVNELSYYVQFLWSGTTSSQFLSMISANPTNVPPFPSPTNNIYFQAYYGVYSFGQFLNMINVALAACHTTLLAQPGYPSPGITPPFVTMNAQSGCLALVIPQTYVTNQVDIVLGGGLNDMLNLPWSETIYNVVLTGVPIPNQAYKIAYTTFVNYSYTAGAGWLSTTLLAGQLTGTPYWAAAAYALYTDHDYRASWYQIYQLVITSNLASPEAISTATSGASIQNNSMQILSSWTLDLNGDNHINGQIIYKPQYLKWLNLLTDGPLTQINIQFMSTDRQGNFYPLLLGFGRQASIRLIFRRKNDAGEFLDFDSRKRQRTKQ